MSPKKSRTIVGIGRDDYETKTDGPTALRVTLPHSKGPAFEEPTDPLPRCDARDHKNGSIQRCRRVAIERVTVFAENFWVRINVCQGHKP